MNRLLVRASEIYATVEFNTDAFFNKPAPEPWINILIGSLLSILGLSMWVMRVENLRQKLVADGKTKFEGNLRLRAMISAAIDADSSPYVIVSYSAFSFLFLAGIQLDFQWTLLVMIIFYCFSSLGDTARILMAYHDANSLADIVLTSDLLKSRLRNVSTELKPTSVYEDLGRGRSVVCMIFVTQVIMISFVCVDIFENDTTRCRDGSSPCPIGGTLGSWGFYLLGIFMACVFQLGPKTHFGRSEQNPSYWLQLLLATKKTGAKVTWFNPVKNKELQRELNASDIDMWIRFAMSYIINGVGYHILVHALPLQVAFQSSFTSVVFRAVGMMYIVDLDDTPGYTLTVVDLSPPNPDKAENLSQKPLANEPQSETRISDMKIQPSAGSGQHLDTKTLSAEVQKILEEAQSKLDALSKSRQKREGRTKTDKIPPRTNVVGGALMVTNSSTVPRETDIPETDVPNKPVIDIVKDPIIDDEEANGIEVSVRKTTRITPTGEIVTHEF